MTATYLACLKNIRSFGNGRKGMRGADVQSLKSFLRRKLPLFSPLGAAPMGFFAISPRYRCITPGGNAVLVGKGGI